MFGPAADVVAAGVGALRRSFDLASGYPEG